MAEEERWAPVTTPPAVVAAEAEPSLSPAVARQGRERRVPSGAAERVVGFASLAAGLGWGAAKAAVGRALGAGSSTPVAPQNELQKMYGAFLTEENADRLAKALSRFRGAPLKLGQILSMQDEAVIPPTVAAALARVRQSADWMPSSQLHGQLTRELGDAWSADLASFDEIPMAAASIGQVHRATLGDGRDIVLKVQYPGVGDSISADIDNVLRLVRLTGALPTGLYIEHAASVAKRELALECDYEHEAAAQRRFKAIIDDSIADRAFRVPGVIDSLSSRRVLASEWVPGVEVAKVAELSQSERDFVASKLLWLTLQTVFVHRFCQTDPNFANFLYSAEDQTISLIDFGAALEFPKEFTEPYLRMVSACARRDRSTVLEESIRLGFLTGDESRAMLDSHCVAAFEVGTPFASAAPYSFAKNAMVANVAKEGPTLIKDRLTPPPEEAYSLHRLLSGVFFLCTRLGATVRASDMLQEVLAQDRP